MNLITHLSKNRGLTLLELLMTLIIVGIINALALPSFSRTLSQNQLATQANILITGLNYARSEAIKRGHPVVIRKTGAEWENGWRIFVDLDRSTTAKTNNFDAGTDLELRIYEALPPHYTLRGNNNFVNFIRYEPTGLSNNIGSFALCDNKDNDNLPQPWTARLIIVNRAGRARIGRDTNNNNIPEREGNIDIVSCTVSPF
jgi:type IV fimbrial biogenesis protein FimT